MASPWQHKNETLERRMFGWGEATAVPVSRCIISRAGKANLRDIGKDGIVK